MGEDNSPLTVAKQGGITLLGSMFGKVVGFLFTAAVTQLVAPSVFGVYTLAIAVVGFTQGVFSLNLHRSIDYFVPRHLNKDREDLAASVLAFVLVAGVATSAVGYVVLVVFANRLGDVFGEPELASLLPLIGIGVLLVTANKTLLRTYNSIKKLKYRAYSKDFVQRVAKLLLMVVLVQLLVPLTGLATAYLLALVGAIATGGYLLVKNHAWILRGGFTTPNVYEVLSYSLPLVFVGIIYAVVGQIDYFVIGRFRGSADIGVYRVAFLLASNILIFLKSVTPVLKPILTENTSDPATLSDNYQLAARWVTLMTLPVALTFMVAPRTYLSVIFTPAYAEGGPALVLLAAAYLYQALIGPDGMTLEALGYTRLTLVNTVVLVGTNTVLDFALVPEFGIVGAAYGTATALTITSTLGVGEVYYLKRVHPFTADLGKVLLAGVPVLGGGAVLSNLLGVGLGLALALPVVITLVYLGSVFLLQPFGPEDVEVAAKVDERLRRNVARRLVRVDGDTDESNLL